MEHELAAIRSIVDEMGSGVNNAVAGSTDLRTVPHFFRLGQHFAAIIQFIARSDSALAEAHPHLLALYEGGREARSLTQKAVHHLENQEHAM
jgi:hypothetical protein